MKRILIISLLCLFCLSVFPQHDVRGAMQIGKTETLYQNEITYGLTCTFDHVYISLGTTSNPKYDHSYRYVNAGYMFNISRYFSIGPTAGYSYQRGSSGSTYNIFNYGYAMQGIYPLKGISKNGGLLVNFEMSRHHTNYGIGLQVFF